MSTYVLSGGIRHGAAERMVVAAALTPAIHDVQAWRFHVVPGLVEVVTDAARLRTMTDPRGRSLHLSCGAALLNLRLAAAQLSREPVVRLLPDRSRPTLLATLRLAGPHRTAPSERLLYAAGLKPVPPRQPYGDPRPPLPVLNELAEAARIEGASLRPVEDGGTLTHVLSTPGDGPVAWLRAGQALQRVLLTAATRGVSTSFLYTHDSLPGQLEHGEFPQAVLQLSRAALR